MLANIDRCYYKTSGVYAIIANEYGKIYIGSSINLYKRTNQHINHLKHKKHSNRYLQRFYNKYGSKNLEIWVLKVFEKSITNKKLREYEQIYVDKLYDNQEKCFNLSNDTIHLTASPKGLLSQKRKITQYWKDNKKKLLPAIMKNLEKAREAQQEKVRLGIKQKAWNKSKKTSAEVIAKMKISAIKRGRNRATPVNMYDKNWKFIKSFQCMVDAALELSGNYKLAANISAACLSKRPTAFGYRWLFANKENPCCIIDF